MKNILPGKLVPIVLLGISIRSFAQKNIVMSEAPPPTAEGDIGAAPTTPIDNYIILLMLVAVFIIGYFARKYKTANCL